MHDNYYVAKQNKEFEKRSIYSSAYCFQDKRDSLEFSQIHLTNINTSHADPPSNDIKKES